MSILSFWNLPAYRKHTFFSLSQCHRLEEQSPLGEAVVVQRSVGRFRLFRGLDLGRMSVCRYMSHSLISNLEVPKGYFALLLPEVYRSLSVGSDCHRV